VYEFALDKFSFDDKKYINVHFDYQHHKAGGRKLQRGYVEPGNQLPCYPTHKNRGWIELRDDQVHSLRLELADGYQNTSVVHANVQRAGSATLPATVAGGQGQTFRSAIHRNVCVIRLGKPVTRQLQGLTVTYADGSTGNLPPAYLDGADLVYLLDLNQSRTPVAVGDPIAGHKVEFHLAKKVHRVKDNVVELGELQVFLPALPLHLRRLPSGSAGLSDSYEVGRTDQPIFKAFVLQFKPPKGGNAGHMVVARKQGSSWVYVGNERKEDGSIVASSNDFGTFRLMADSTAPLIRSSNFKDGSTIPASQSDNFSGIQSQKILCTIDGKWELFEYDYKNATITHTFPYRTNARHLLQVMVYDNAGNLAQESYSLTF
jgi:hypothetical protein